MCVCVRLHLFVFFPKRFPVFFEDGKNNLVAVYAAPKSFGLESSNFYVPALFVELLTPPIEVEDVRIDLPQIQCVERIIEEDHLCICAVAFAPVILLANACARYGSAIDPVDCMETHRPNEFLIVRFDGTHNIIRHLAVTSFLREPLFLFVEGEGKGVVHKESYFRIVEPYVNGWRIGLLKGTKNYLLSRKEYNWYARLRGCHDASPL